MITINPNRDMSILHNLIRDKEVQKAKLEINTIVSEILLLDLPNSPPYPETPAQVKPYYTFLHNYYAVDSQIKEISERVKLIARLIMTTNPILAVPTDEPGQIYQSMVTAMGSIKTIEFVSVVGLQPINELITYLDTKRAGDIEKLVQLA